jgi:general secretion pathway protein I
MAPMPLFLSPNKVHSHHVVPIRTGLTHRARLGGFTLIEVLIALVIIALVGVVLAQTSYQSVDQTDYLKRKLMASWVAENRMTELRLQTQQGQEVSLTESEVEQASWRFRTVANLDTQAAGVMRIEIQVFQPPQADSPLFTLTGYLPASIRALNSKGDLSVGDLSVGDSGGAP